MSHVLFVVTSYNRLLDGTPTGLWLEEFAIPYLALKDAGHEVTVASVAGGEVPVDPNSRATDDQAREWAGAIAQLNDTQPFDRFNASDFDAVYLPGGHGTLFDMPYNTRLHELLYDFDDNGKYIAAVCHAPAVFTGMHRTDGTPWVQGRKVSAFTDAEEAQAVGAEKVPFLLESRLKTLGAEHEGTDPWQPLVIQDGRLITGQNPQSSAEVAHWLRTALAA